MNSSATNNESHSGGGHERSESGLGPILFVMLAWAITIGLSVASYRPVAPKPTSIADDLFSAMRADRILEELVGDSIPHPAGSEQNKIVRQRIVGLLESFGYQIEIQSGVGRVRSSVKNRSPDKDVVPLNNIIARRPGATTASHQRPALMLVSHYDSVPSGPGASDDGVGTAALLEIARMLSQEPAPGREVVFLITDGEELGLLGAELFVNDHPLADKIGLAINLEARGTTGPSLMFETSRASRQLIPLFARSSPKPMCSSLFFEIYKRLPNDTDFTLLNEDGMLGFNFAFIGDVKNYHTTADNFENVDRGSLQHHGGNALRLIRECLSTDEIDELLLTRLNEESDPDEAVYFDLFGQWVIWWPSSWSIWFCVVALAGILIRLTTSGGEEVAASWRTRLCRLFVALTMLLVAILVISGVGYLIQSLVQRDPRMSNPWPRQPVPILIGFWTASLAVVIGLTLVCSKWLDPRSILSAFCWLWLGLAFASSVWLTGACYLFVVPVVGTVIVGMAARIMGDRGLTTTLVAAAILVGVIWLPMERLFYDAVGFRMPIALLVRMSLVGTTTVGLFALANNRTKLGVAIATGAISIAAFASAIWLNSEAL